MTLLHIVVSRDSVMLAEYVNSAFTGTFPEATYGWLRDLTRKPDLGAEASQIVPEEAVTVLRYSAALEPVVGRWTLHLINKEGLQLAALVATAIGRQSVYNALHGLHAELLEQVGIRFTYAKRMELNKDFQPALARAAARLEPRDSLSKVKTQVNEVKNIVDENIQSALARGEQLDSLMGKSEDLEVSSTSFKRKAVKVKKTMWWQHVKMKIFITVLILGIIYASVSIGCGGPAWPKCIKKKKK